MNIYTLIHIWWIYVTYLWRFENNFHLFRSIFRSWIYKNWLFKHFNFTVIYLHILQVCIICYQLQCESIIHVCVLGKTRSLSQIAFTNEIRLSIAGQHLFQKRQNYSTEKLKLLHWRREKWQQRIYSF